MRRHHSASPRPVRPHRRPCGFTLVEILIVVVILGILAAIVVPQFGTAADETRQKVFASTLRQFARAAQQWSIQNDDQFIEDASSGVLPVQLQGLIPDGKWEGGTPIGGVWDSERDGFAGMSSGVGVHFNGGTQPSDAEMAIIDGVIDDGDITTGRFRKFGADRFYYILVE